MRTVVFVSGANKEFLTNTVYQILDEDLLEGIVTEKQKKC
jgi:hypothetical protein